MEDKDWVSEMLVFFSATSNVTKSLPGAFSDKSSWNSIQTEDDNLE